MMEIRVKTPYGGGIFEQAKKPESMLKNHSSTALILSYFQHWLMYSKKNKRSIISISLKQVSIFFRLYQKIYVLDDFSYINYVPMLYLLLTSPTKILFHFDVDL